MKIATDNMPLDTFLVDKASKHFQNGNYQEAKKLLLEVPLDADVSHRLAVICFIMKQSEDTEKYCRSLLTLRPDFLEGYKLLILALVSQNKNEELLKTYKEVTEKYPKDENILHCYFWTLNQLCYWGEYEELSSRLDVFSEEQKTGKLAESPFENLARCSDEDKNYAVAKSRSREIFKHTFGFDRPQTKAITIGYLSDSFRNYPSAHLTIDLYKQHNRADFKVNCYSFGEDDESYYRDKIKSDCDNFVDIRRMSDRDAAKRISSDGVDILVDMKGYTENHRASISAMRPAPIMVRWLGIAGTTASRFFDYIITDKIVTPPDAQEYYSEKFVYMPDCYQINSRNQRISDKEYSRADFGLPEKSIVFCSFSQGYKIEPVMFNVWMNILRQVPGSVLWLMAEGVKTENLKAEASVRGVDPRRLIFAECLPKEEHLKRLELADIAMDTRIVNGAITTSDALYAGVPLITLLGSNFSSRMSASILTVFGMPELITGNISQYEKKLVELAVNPDLLLKTKECVLANRLTSPLFDTPRYTKNIEKGYKEMWEIYMNGELPRQIEIKEKGFRICR